MLVILVTIPAQFQLQYAVRSREEFLVDDRF